jgi:hypothetical protein
VECSMRPNPRCGFGLAGIFSTYLSLYNRPQFMKADSLE